MTSLHHLSCLGEDCSDSSAPNELAEAATGCDGFTVAVRNDQWGGRTRGFSLVADLAGYTQPPVTFCPTVGISLRKLCYDRAQITKHFN